jgi:hypothetical protein
MFCLINRFSSSLANMLTKVWIIFRLSSVLFPLFLLLSDKFSIFFLPRTPKGEKY